MSLSGRNKKPISALTEMGHYLKIYQELEYDMQFPTIQENTSLQQAVDAKELYEALGLNTAHWSRWRIANIVNNPFALEGEDYEGFTIMVSGNQTINYLLSVDLAKKLAMQVRTEQGEQVRNYFLDCERKNNQVVPAFQIPQTLGEALQLAANQALQIEQDAPKVNAYDKLINSKNLKSVGDVAKSIGLRSAQALNKKLETVNAYDGRCANRVWSGWFIEQGLGEMKTTDDGYSSNKMTAKGQAWALDLFGGNE